MVDDDFYKERLLDAVIRFFEKKKEDTFGGDKVITEIKNHYSTGSCEIYMVQFDRQDYINLKTAYENYKKSLGVSPEEVKTGSLFVFSNIPIKGTYTLVEEDGVKKFMDKQKNIYSFTEGDLIIPNGGMNF